MERKTLKRPWFVTISRGWGRVRLLDREGRDFSRTYEFKSTSIIAIDKEPFEALYLWRRGRDSNPREGVTPPTV